MVPAATNSCNASTGGYEARERHSCTGFTANAYASWYLSAAAEDAYRNEYGTDVPSNDDSYAASSCYRTSAGTGTSTSAGAGAGAGSSSGASAVAKPCESPWSITASCKFPQRSGIIVACASTIVSPSSQLCYASFGWK